MQPQPRYERARLSKTSCLSDFILGDISKLNPWYFKTQLNPSLRENRQNLQRLVERAAAPLVGFG